MLMLNAVYFNGYWRRPFLNNMTLEMPFFKTPESKVKAQFMRQTEDFYYSESRQLDAQILRIPYKVIAINKTHTKKNNNGARCFYSIRRHSFNYNLSN